MIDSCTFTSLDKTAVKRTLIENFGLPVVTHSLAANIAAIIQAATEIAYPLVMKTAEPGIAHKSYCGGVIVNIQDQQALEQAYADLQSRLGSKVVIMPTGSTGHHLLFTNCLCRSRIQYQPNL